MGVSLQDFFYSTATFGFEIEFLVLFKEYGTSAPWVVKEGEDNGRIRKPVLEEPHDFNETESEHELHMSRLHYFGNQIARELTEAGVVAKYREKGHPTDDGFPNLKSDDSKLGPFDGFCYNAYRTTTIVPEETMIWTDPNMKGARMLVRPESPQGYFWLGFEIVSHAYRHRDFRSAQEDLMTICKTLRSKYMISINAGKDSEIGSSRCGIHIHWGLSGQQYKLLHIKRLLTLMWMTEEDLMGLHATWRQSAFKYAALLRRQTNMALDKGDALPRWLGDLDTGTPAPWRTEMELNIPRPIWESLYQNKPKVQWLWRADEVEDLAKLIGESKMSRKAAIGITELLPANSKFSGKVRRSCLNTIEFRHMQGSLCPELIAAWVEVTGKMVEICVRSSADDFKQFLEKVRVYALDKDWSAYTLLGILGVEENASRVFKEHNQHRLDEEADSDKTLFLPPLD
ncbi:hypothetical protein F4810DRAFT_717068 [Camillea tinctor]|nr:hypothetical protein F4810DRAFT_717068 [Camillea tinctor]